jgi:hypothetical protein
MIDAYEEYEWYLKEDLSRYAGMWIAILDKKVVASGRNIAKVLEDFKKSHPGNTPLITKINAKLSVL